MVDIANYGSNAVTCLLIVLALIVLAKAKVTILSSPRAGGQRLCHILERAAATAN